MHLFVSVPSGFPMNITATALSPTKIRVNWTTFPMIDHNGNITSYEVQFNQSVAIRLFPPSDTVVVPPNVFTVVLTNLGPLLYYTVTVRAHTLIGPGPYNPDNATAETEPGRKFTGYWDYHSLISCVQFVRCSLRHNFISIHTAPPAVLPPPRPSPPERPVDLPPDVSEINVTIMWDPLSVTGGTLQRYIVYLRALGIGNETTTRTRRQSDDDPLDNCVMNINRIFSVPPDVTELSVSVGMFNKTLTVFMHKAPYFYFLSLFHNIPVSSAG